MPLRGCVANGVLGGWGQGRTRWRASSPDMPVRAPVRVAMHAACDQKLAERALDAHAHELQDLAPHPRLVPPGQQLRGAEPSHPLHHQQALGGALWDGGWHGNERQVCVRALQGGGWSRVGPGCARWAAAARAKRDASASAPPRQPPHLELCCVGSLNPKVELLSQRLAHLIRDHAAHGRKSRAHGMSAQSTRARKRRPSLAAWRRRSPQVSADAGGALHDADGLAEKVHVQGDGGGHARALDLRWWHMKRRESERGSSSTTRDCTQHSG